MRDGGDVAEHDDVVAGAGGEDEEVPEVVGVEAARPEMGAVGGENEAASGVEQAAGKEPIPGGTTPNGVHTGLNWDDAERPLMYGYGARRQYGAQHAQWNDKLETSLKSDWEAEHAGVGDTLKQQWEDVKDVVRHGYGRARS